MRFITVKVTVGNVEYIWNEEEAGREGHYQEEEEIAVESSAPNADGIRLGQWVDAAIYNASMKVYEKERAYAQDHPEED